MNNNRPHFHPLTRLALLGALALSVACAHGASAPRPEENVNFAVGPGGKAPSVAMDFESNRSAPNFTEPAARERIPVEILSVPPSALRR